MSIRSVARSVRGWFCLTRWENYCLLAMASLAFLAVVSVRSDAHQAAAPSPDRPKIQRLAKVAEPLDAAPRAREVPWLERNEIIKRRAAQPVDVILLGDSITQGWDFKDHWQEYFPDISAVNAGISSDRVEHVLWRTRDGMFQRAHPKVVVLLAGINNLALHSAERIAATQAETIRSIQAASPGTKILLLAVFPSGAAPDHPRRAKISRLNDQLRRLADGNRVQFLDFGKRFLETDGSLAKTTSFDYVHLTGKGYRIWANAMGPKLRRMLATEATVSGT